MRDSFLIRGKELLGGKIWARNIKSVIKNNNVILVSIAFVIFGLMLRIWNAQPVFYAYAYTGNEKNIADKVKSPLLDNQISLFTKDGNKSHLADVRSHIKDKKQTENVSTNASLADKLYAIVGESPIKEMIPFISRRDEKVAAFLVAIAKKESSFGEHSPSLDGQDCHNYWGYKGLGGNGSSMGYACFGSAEEAIETVGNRIEVLVNKNRNTPARMVNTWKCGTDCSGDPGAAGWVSTVALYFEKIVS